MIDPDTKNHEDGVVEKLHVDGWDRAEATYAVAPGRFGVSTRTMMVLNAVSSKDRSLISTPIFHNSYTVVSRPPQKTRWQKPINVCRLASV